MIHFGAELSQAHTNLIASQTHLLSTHICAFFLPVFILFPSSSSVLSSSYSLSQMSSQILFTHPLLQTLSLLLCLSIYEPPSFSSLPSLPQCFCSSPSSAACHSNARCPRVGEWSCSLATASSLLSSRQAVRVQPPSPPVPLYSSGHNIFFCQCCTLPYSVHLLL